MNVPHAVYLVHFYDNRLKIGISSDARKRMNYYIQEIRRNFCRGMTWYACKPFKNKQQALIVETTICRWLKEFSISGHREWFSNATGEGFGKVIVEIEKLRKEIGEESDVEKNNLPYEGDWGSFKND